MAERWRPTIESKDKREPFVIRGHHFDHFISLINGETTPKERAENIRTENAAIHAKYPRKSQRYKEDTVGKSAKEAKGYQKRIKTIFETFMELPEEYPVTLIAGQKDTMCHACVRGDHCNFDDQSLFGAGNDALRQDEKSLSIFQLYARKQKLPIKAETEMVNFTDKKGFPAMTVSLFTTAGVVKKIFSDPKFIDARDVELSEYIR